jgi:hypothetical protein
MFIATRAAERTHFLGLKPEKSHDCIELVNVVNKIIINMPRYRNTAMRQTRLAYNRHLRNIRSTAHVRNMRVRYRAYARVNRVARGVLPRRNFARAQAIRRVGRRTNANVARHVRSYL